MSTLQLAQTVEGDGYQVEIALKGDGAERKATARFVWQVGDQEREDIRWYLEDYLQYPIHPAPMIAARVEQRLAELGRDLFAKVFEANRDTLRLWDAVSDRLADTRIEVVTPVEDAAAVPWELLRDPVTGTVLALRARAFVHTDPHTPRKPVLVKAAETVRVLLVICRPAGGADVPFRSVASHLVRLSRDAREAFQLDVLRPPTFAQLSRRLEAAERAGRAYHVVHFDGHGAYLDEEGLAATAKGRPGGLDPLRYSVLSPVRKGSHGYLLFEDPDTPGNAQLVDGPALGEVLVGAGVGVLVLNACRSAHADLATQPDMVDDGGGVHSRVRAYGSLAQEVIHAGVGGVVAMRYNVYVVTAAQFVGDLYAGLAGGQPLGQAVTAGRRQLAAKPHREIAFEPLVLRDWMVPVVYEAAELPVLTPQTGKGLRIRLSQAEAAPERAQLDPSLPGVPDVGFYGRDETLLALDRAFDDQQVVLLHAWAGAGKTATAVEFARWYQLTGGLHTPDGGGLVLFTSFAHGHVPLVRVLDDVGVVFGQMLEGVGVQWAALSDSDRRQVALQVLAQVPVLWIWDNVEPVAGFPAGTPSAWSVEEQEELVGFLRDLRDTKAKVLLTSRRDEQGWLGGLAARVRLPGMPMAERVQLARAVAKKHGRRLTEVADWRPLLEFTQGNPLTVTVLVGQALRDNLRTKEQGEGFVTRLRGGAAQIADAVEQGRDRSLGASLSYGLDHAFTEAEQAQVALLHLFQGFINVDALHLMSDPDTEHCVAELRGLTREAGVGLLDRAAEIGLLTRVGDGFYTIHPALPWFFHQRFTTYYGPPDQPTAIRTVRAYTEAIATLGNYYHDQYEAGRAEVIDLLGFEEANLLHALPLARTHGWWDQAMRAMQGLRTLYEHTGRTGEWRRLVDELVPDFVDPDTDGPLPNRETHWAIVNDYRVRLAIESRDWPRAEHLQQAAVSRDRQRAATALTVSPEMHDDEQRLRIRSLAASVHTLGQILREQLQPDCVPCYQEAIQLCQRIGAQHDEAVVTYNLGHAYLQIPNLRDPDQAQRWYRTSLQLFDQHDVLGRATCVAHLGAVAIERFHEALAAGGSAHQLQDHLSNAATAYHQALSLYPDDAVNELAVTHHQLGNIYDKAGDVDTALSHYQRSIRYEERQGNRYGAGQTRGAVALALVRAGREDALVYAQAALRDFEQIGAATDIEDTKQLIAIIEQLAAQKSYR